MKKTMMIAAMALLAALLPAQSALAAPTIDFLNPSAYATPMTISDLPDKDGFVHLVAWAREVPSPALVEFEITPPGQNASTFTAERVGNDTWEAFVPIPNSYADTTGYKLTARLYRGVPGDADEVDNAEITVEVDQSDVPPPTAETVEMSYPDNGDPLGFHVPKGKLPITVFDYQSSPDTRSVRAYYTRTDPGGTPAWEDCGADGVPEGGFGQVRCVLKEGHNPLDVTAVALVANKAPHEPPAPPNAALDDTGDAHRVLPYLQEPRTVEVAQGGVTVELAKCHIMTAFVSDQLDRSVPGANVDIHADGPEDELYFAESGTATDAFQAPDGGTHPSKEVAKRCSNTENRGQQGDHNSPGRDDAKHIESVAGTNDNGGFRFALKSEFAGGTFITAFADVNDDDTAGLNEATGGTQIGWGTPPPQPSLEVFLTPTSAEASTGSCVAFEVIARRGGAPHANGNIDLHLQGPDDTVDFCPVTGGGTHRGPDSGGHLGEEHEDGTKHAEAETDGAGRFTFGVTSPSQGTTTVGAWIDSADDDILSGEPSKTATVTWSPPGTRSITIASNKSRVAKGRRVTLSGAIDGDPACSDGQAVQIQAKPVNRGTFGAVKTVTTDAEGRYSTRIRMRAARKFRAVAPTSGSCSQARSRTITVRVR